MPSLVSRLTPYRPELLALAAGALLVLGYAPFSWYPVALIALAILVQTLVTGTPGTGFRRGLLFGLGLFGCGVFWIRISLNEFGNMGAGVANLLMALFVLVVALYYAAAGWLLRRLASGVEWADVLLLFPGLYVLLEWVRGWLFTGFPWLDLGYTQTSGPLAGYAPVAGVYGVSLVVAFAGALAWCLVRWSGYRRILAGLALVAIWLGGFGLQRVDWTSPAGPAFKASVLQANIPQQVKWAPDATITIAEIYLELTRDHLDSQLILWPETALPDFLHLLREPLIDPLAERARQEGTDIVLGIPVMDESSGRYYNGLLSIGHQEDLYAKRHLVPFGEFMPFKALLGPLVQLFEVPMSDFSPGSARRPLLQVGNRLAGATICYEDAFPAEVVQAMPDAQFLLNVSNDAWFGDSLAPHQHLEMSRMRAIENGRYMVRATNTGISAIIDERGRILTSVPSFVRGAASAEVRPLQGATPFARVHNWLALGLAALMVGAGILLGRAAARRKAALHDAIRH